MAEDRRNIILTGFMGSGKTAVGRELARLLCRRFTDLDRVVAEEAGMPVREVFRRKGEAAFRRMEHRAIRGLAGTQGRIIAAGGGAPVFPRNRGPLRRGGIVVYLKAPASVLARRLAHSTNRPLLAPAAGRPSALRALISRLLRKRARCYGMADVIVDAGRGSPATVAKRVMAGLRRGSRAKSAWRNSCAGCVGRARGRV